MRHERHSHKNSFNSCNHCISVSRLTYPLVLLMCFCVHAGIAGASGFASEIAEIGAGGSVCYSFPLGWFDDRKMSPNVGFEAHTTYSLDGLLPNLTARASLYYQTFDGTRNAGYAYDFSDLSLYFSGIYYHDFGLPLKPYILAGIGFDHHRIDWSYERPGHHYSKSESGIGFGLIAGGGAFTKATDRLGLFGEMTIQSSTWVAGAGILDFIIRMMVGVTFSIQL